MKKPYHIVSRDEKTATVSIEQFAKANGQLLLPLLELVSQARVAVDEVISSIGRKTIETILTLSAEHVAGEQTPGKISGDIRWHGSQNGRVALADRQLKVKRPRLRHKQEGEVKVPAYEALQENGATAQRMMGALLRGVSTRQYEEVLPEMAETAGVSRSSVSRQAIEGSAEQLRQLRERRWDKTDLLVIYIDGQRFGDHHVISGVGIDREGSKHILGIEMGATENATAVKKLLTGCAIEVCPRTSSIFSSLTVPKLCARESRKCLEAISRYSAAAITRCGTYWMNCRANSTHRSST